MSERTGAEPKLGLLTSLPLYWPLSADFAELASGSAPAPWQRAALQQRFDVVPVDTLAPVPALDPDAAPSDPLAGIERLALIQPRGLSAADNVALDDWVREGGALLLALDPALTGRYGLPLGDPRMPSMAALIPPVVARWGLRMSFDADQTDDVTRIETQAGTVPILVSGVLSHTPESAGECAIAAQGALAHCAIGEGRVTLIADAAVFEHRELAGAEGEAIAALLREAFP
ncbi:MAG: hypothetical protein AAFR88_04600 [Pseudomonadota bacterium]